MAIAQPQTPHEDRAFEEGPVDYRALVERIPAITYTEVHETGTSGGQRTTFVSPQASAILGHAPAEFLVDPELWRKLRHPADRATVMAAERVAEVTKRPFRAEYRMYDRRGRLHWFRDEAVILERSGETVWQGVMFDISSEKEAAAQAHRAELRYRSLVESLPCVVYIDQLDERATNVYTGPQTESVFGYTQQDWVDDPDLWLGRLVHPDDRERCRVAEIRHAETAEPFDETYRALHRDGHMLWVRDVAIVVRGEDGTPLYSQGFMLDITEQKTTESKLEDALARERGQAEQLRSLDELKNTLLHTLSHDLKGPLTAVLVAATALRRPDVTESETREILDGMTARAKKMDRLLSDLLDLERLGRGIVEPNRYPVDVGEFLTALVSETEALDGRQFDLVARPVVALVDPPKLERMVENLLTNASRHTPADGRVWIRVTAQDDGALICVEDEGPGVPEELADAIFEPFRKADPDSPGTGIGLSLVRRFAELHGGRAWVQGRPGGGASFRLLLPGPQRS